MRSVSEIVKHIEKQVKSVAKQIKTGNENYEFVSQTGMTKHDKLVAEHDTLVKLFKFIEGEANG